MIKVQNHIDRFQENIIKTFYFILKIVLSFSLGYLSARCVIFKEFSPFSIVFLAVSINTGLIPTFCYLGSSLGILFSPFNLSTFKYITSLTMIYIIYMVFRKSLHILHTDTAVLAASCTFVSGFLFLIVSDLTLFNALFLIAESLLICCCIYFVNYTIKAFKKNCYLSTRDIIAAAITFILILLSMQRLTLFHMNIARIIGITLIILTLYTLKTSQILIFSSVTAILLTSISQDGDVIFSSLIIATLAGTLLMLLKQRFYSTAFLITYYISLIFFNKFPWNYWLFGEAFLGYIIGLVTPKEKLRNLLSRFISIRSKTSVKMPTEKILSACKTDCFDICPRAKICYSKNENELIDAIETQLTAYKENRPLPSTEALITFCIKKEAMQTILERSIRNSTAQNTDLMIEELEKITKQIESRILPINNSIKFLDEEENHIQKALGAAGIAVKDICFTSDEEGLKRCVLQYSANNVENHQNIVQLELKKYFSAPISIHIEQKDHQFTVKAKECNKFSVSCAALSKAKRGESCCGDQAIGFTINKKHYCILLADGMGSGESAHTQSQTIINYVHRLLLGGIKPTAALNVFRSILRLSSPIGFSTIDICTIDLLDGTIEFHKAGAYDSILVKKDRHIKIPGGGIPLGLSEQERIKHEKLTFTDGDYLIMSSDGLSPFQDKLEAYTSELYGLDARTYAHSLLSRLSAQGEIAEQDDITLVVCKFEKSKE